MRLLVCKGAAGLEILYSRTATVTSYPNIAFIKQELAKQDFLQRL